MKKILNLITVSFLISIQALIIPISFATYECTLDCGEGEVCSIVTDDAGTETEQCTDDTKDCKTAYRDNYDNCKANAGDDTNAKDDCKETRKEARQNCRNIGAITATTGLEGEDLINSLVPNQSTLFGNDENIKLTEGDLEQELAPQLLKLLVRFSSLIGFALFTFLGIKLILARSDEEAYTSAKNALIHTFVGAIIIAASFGIVVAILQIFNSL